MLTPSPLPPGGTHPQVSSPPGPACGTSEPVTQTAAEQRSKAEVQQGAGGDGASRMVEHSYTRHPAPPIREDPVQTD